MDPTAQNLRGALRDCQGLVASLTLNAAPRHVITHPTHGTCLPGKWFCSANAGSRCKNNPPLSAPCGPPGTRCDPAGWCVLRPGMPSHFSCSDHRTRKVSLRKCWLCLFSPFLSFHNWREKCRDFVKCNKIGFNKKKLGNHAIEIPHNIAGI